MANKDYISEVDRMLAKMRTASERTPQELAEIKKYNRINYLRDHSFSEPESDDII